MKIFTHLQKYTFCLLLLLFFISACSKKEEKPPSKWEQKQESATGQKATRKISEEGGSFNKFFPKGEDGFTVTYTQEKTGFAQAKLEKDGQEFATLSISDTANNSEAAEKYKNSSERLSDYPMVAIGSKGTGILVADRFQVQVRSKVDAFDESDRKAWLVKCDLKGLAALKN